MLLSLTDPSFDYSNPIARALDENEVRISRFENGEEILCARSPHITMGNLFLAKNKISSDDVYARYFNLTLYWQPTILYCLTLQKGIMGNF